MQLVEKSPMAAAVAGAAAGAVSKSLRSSNTRAYGHGPELHIRCLHAAHRPLRARANHQLLQENTMNKDRMEGNWLQFKGKVKEQWGKLTDDDLDVIAGKRDQLLGKIQERHGLSQEEAEQQVTAWKDRNPTDFFERY
jgi:uncharacterized protein YjbJ (UPF0337 family)